MTSNPIDDPHLRQCPACGSQTPVGSPECLHCGAVSHDSTDQIRTASQLHFLQELYGRSNPFTMILIGVNVGVFILMCLAGGFAVTSVNQQVLLGFGAKQNTLIVEQHE